MIRNRFLFFTTAIFSFLIALMSYRFLLLGMDAAFPEMIGHLTNRNLIFIAHVTASPIALVLGTVNMWERRRRKHRVAHRWTGRAYAVAILVGGVSGLGLALEASGGMVATFGFGALSVLWIGNHRTSGSVRNGGRFYEAQQVDDPFVRVNTGSGNLAALPAGVHDFG